MTGPACPDWPHSYVCPTCSGNGCGMCGGTGERFDYRDCRPQHEREARQPRLETWADDDRP